jgi:cellulose synthase/poly-beta-1,6-N-acetylglucosamine synthase-like glycosyltransferase
MTFLTVIFWASLAGILYAYIGYPLLLALFAKISPAKQKDTGSSASAPSVSVIIPAHNEGKIIEKKIQNTLLLDYPEGNFEILVISDGSTDNTAEIVRRYADRIQFHELPERMGKAAALNLGMEKARNEIIIFSDASIMLAPDSILNIVEKFSDSAIGCVSGEDHIHDGSGEGLYGKYELFLRNLESKLHSIVGASGSFYGQRRDLCLPFPEGLAPDFLSVLNTVEQGYRAVTEPRARGTMASLQDVREETGRKVRTLIRGITTLQHKKNMLNPLLYGIFSWELFSHKLMRWLVPYFLIMLFAVNIVLLPRPLYIATFLVQVLLYVLTLAALWKVLHVEKTILGRVPLYFVMANIAILKAWYKYARGVRQEIWNPTKR